MLRAKIGSYHEQPATLSMELTIPAHFKDVMIAPTTAGVKVMIDTVDLWLRSHGQPTVNEADTGKEGPVVTQKHRVAARITVKSIIKVIHLNVQYKHCWTTLNIIFNEMAIAENCVPTKEQFLDEIRDYFVVIRRKMGEAAVAGQKKLSEGFAPVNGTKKDFEERNAAHESKEAFADSSSYTGHRDERPRDREPRGGGGGAGGGGDAKPKKVKKVKKPDVTQPSAKKQKT